MKTTNDIRKLFLDYFKRQGHAVVKSSGLVPQNDPTLMFTNSGMVQFKNLFTGLEKRDYTRATTAQKCVRAGGKHNDLDNVGYTARHHTFFEMLGNFSFSDYFKEEAIHFAWECLTKDFGVSKDKLCVTVYHEDDEAASIWKKLTGFSDHRIIRIPTSDNFWSMGDTGPCGPCSEIFYDHGEHIVGGPPGSPGADGDRFVEIWNLVFMQFEQLAGGERISLPNPCIDTGMGLERIAAVLQGVSNNYDTDVFQTLIAATSHEVESKVTDANHASFKVIADHLRSTSFLIADGVMPSNEGRGYVLRRIMRRAMRHAHILGSKDPLMWRLVPALVTAMGQSYPELERAQELIQETLRSEEERFRTTLGRGLKLLEQELESLGKDVDFSGDAAFKLYDTYGFPLDLTQDILRNKGRVVNTEGFDTCMEAQKAKARAAWAGSGEEATETIWFDLREQHGSTEFLGYLTEKAEGQVQALIVNGKEVTSLKTSEEGWVLLNQTPFYAESGGQVGDIGEITGEDNLHVEVLDVVKRLEGLHAHKVKILSGALTKGDGVNLIVNHENRSQLRAHHSVTHLLHAALRKSLGNTVTQKGSLVTPTHLRFDFNYGKPVPKDMLREVEQNVNREIRANTPVITHLMSQDEAIAKGAMALFGEKYGDEVRVVSMGTEESGKTYSTELCGGTHVRYTGDMGFFKILSESSISAGVRRVEAVAGLAAETHVLEQEEVLGAAAELLKTTPLKVFERLQGLLEERKKLERDLTNAKQSALSGGSVMDDVETIQGISFYAKELHDVHSKDMRPMVDRLKQNLKSGVIGLFSVNEGKVSAIVAVTSDLTDRWNAKDLIQPVCDALGAQGGGGRPDMAQCGGSDPKVIPAAIEALRKAL
jgi:alanyl-tRNA synthetase